MRLKKALLVVVGCLSLALGAIGGGASDSANSSVSYAVSLLLCEKLREAAQLVHIYEALQEES